MVNRTFPAGSGPAGPHNGLWIAGLAAEPHGHLGAAVAVHRIAGADDHLGDAFRDPDSAQGAREGLLGFVRMHQHAAAVDRAVGPDHVPLIGIVVPANSRNFANVLL